MLSFFPRGVLDEILNLIESVSEGFPSYSGIFHSFIYVGIFWYNFTMHREGWNIPPFILIKSCIQKLVFAVC